MPSLYLSEPFREPPVRDDEVLDRPREQYMQAMEGVVALCAQRSWTLYRSGETTDYDVVTEHIDASAIRVCLRIPHMRTAMLPGWELARSSLVDSEHPARPLFVFKTQPTTEFDEYWLGKPQAQGFVGDAPALLAAVDAAMRATLS